MESIKKQSQSLEDLTTDEIAELIETNDILDRENERIVKEKKEDNERKEYYSINKKMIFVRLRKSPIEILNRSLFFLFLGSFLFSFVSVYKANIWWFVSYLISAFSCILYTPNRKALKELLAAWPNIVDLIKRRSLWK